MYLISGLHRFYHFSLSPIFGSCSISSKRPRISAPSATRAAAASHGTKKALNEDYLLHFEYIEAPISNIEDQKRHGEDNSGILVDNVDIFDAGHGRF